MNEIRLKEFPVAHLEYIFTPPGMPLVAKGEDEHGTTSILVRGGAGAGKTTLALALAHAIAKNGGGLVLYLTTEFSPAEIAYKATLIGLTEESVDVWPGTHGAKAGDVVVEHLSEVRKGKPILTSVERKKSSIDAVWGLLHPEAEGKAKPPLPVRAVVIDALTLPDAGEDEKSLRADLVAFVQALENEGVSVVLVEELASGAAAWSAFVVDVVIELAFVPDVDTHDLRRKLTLSKCRYSTSLPGPHDYGLDYYKTGTRTAVWPDMFKVIMATHQRMLAWNVRRVPVIRIPKSKPGEWAALQSSVLLSPYDKVGVSAINAIDSTPGVRGFAIRCGALTDVIAERAHRAVLDDEGVHAIAWTVYEMVRALDVNTCVIHNFGHITAGHGAIPRAIHLVEALRLLGLLVCVHSTTDSMRSLEHSAALTWNGAFRNIPVKEGRQRRFTRVLLRNSWSNSGVVAGIAGAVEESGSPDMLVQRCGAVRKSASTRRITGAADGLDHLQAALSLDLTGSSRNEPRIQQLLNMVSSNVAPQAESAWFALHAGAAWHAARAALRAVETDTPSPSLLLLWKAICAVVAANEAAVDGLKGVLKSADEHLILYPLLSGLLQTGRLEESDLIAADFAARHTLPSWQLERLHADTRLDSDELAIVNDAAVRFDALERNEQVPLIHRAESVYNLGVAKDRLGDRTAAISAFHRALTLNPYLDAAREELTHLGEPVPPPPA